MVNSTTATEKESIWAGGNLEGIYSPRILGGDSHVN